jgi:hypothetical protein
VVSLVSCLSQLGLANGEPLQDIRGKETVRLLSCIFPRKAPLLTVFPDRRELFIHSDTHFPQPSLYFHI